MTVATMSYPPAPGWSARHKSGSPEDRVGLDLEPPAIAPPLPLQGLFTNEELEAALLVGREEAFGKGREQAQKEFELVVAQQRHGVAQALQEFAQSREEYFHQVEGEVVALALAIVRKILHREAQVDPMLLSGLVRVALEKMAASQTLRMHVHPSQIAAWNQYFEEHPDLAKRPELSGDSALEPNCCHIETEMGVTNLNLAAQMKEIEQGLFDLLAQRPPAKATA